MGPEKRVVALKKGRAVIVINFMLFALHLIEVQKKLIVSAFAKNCFTLARVSHQPTSKKSIFIVINSLCISFKIHSVSMVLLVGW